MLFIYNMLNTSIICCVIYFQNFYVVYHMPYNIFNTTDSLPIYLSTESMYFYDVPKTRKSHDILEQYHDRSSEIHGKHSRELLPQIKVLHILISSSVIRHDWFIVLLSLPKICICVTVYEFIATPNQRHNVRFFNKQQHMFI